MLYINPIRRKAALNSHTGVKKYSLLLSYKRLYFCTMYKYLIPNLQVKQVVSLNSIKVNVGLFL
jgi:hypothetical protein